MLNCFSTFRRAVLLCLLCAVFLTVCVGANIYYAPGFHGGYYLTDEDDYRDTLDRLFAALDQEPELKVVLELEPYTIERMLHGEEFACEARRYRGSLPAFWHFDGTGTGSRLLEAGLTGYGARLTSTGSDWAFFGQTVQASDLQGHSLVFSATVRARDGGVAVIYCDASSGNDNLGGWGSDAVPPDGQWHEVSAQMTIPSNAVVINPRIMSSQPTQADFDNVSLWDTNTGQEVLRNGDFEQAKPKMQDLNRLARLREFVREGRVEIIGGTYAQPILYALGEESTARQFLYGCRAVEEALNVPVKTYGAQEPCMTGQLPLFLDGFGYSGVMYRTYWPGYGWPPRRDADVLGWTGPDGSSIPTIPTYAAVPMAGGPDLGQIATLAGAGVANPFYSNLVDFNPSGMSAFDSSGGNGNGYVSIGIGLAAVSLRGKSLLFSGWIRARKTGAHLWIDTHDSQGSAISAAWSSLVSPDGQWHRVQVTYQVPSNAVDIIPQAKILGSSGDADFLGISLTIPDEGTEVASFGPLDGGVLPPDWGLWFPPGSSVSSQVGYDASMSGWGYVRIVMQAPHLFEFTTLAGHFKAMGQPTTQWSDAYAGFKRRYPFGLLAGASQLDDRKAVDAVLRAERVCMLTGKNRQADLDKAWKLTLMQEHHDGWVCPTWIFGVWTGDGTYGSYSKVTRAASEEAQAICLQLLADNGMYLSASDESVNIGNLDRKSLDIVNISGVPRSQVMDLIFSLPAGTARTPVIYDPDGIPVPAEVKVLRRRPDGSAKWVRAVFLASAPSLGMSRYEVRNGQPAPLDRAWIETSPDKAVLRTGYRQVTISRDGLLQVLDSFGPVLRQPVNLAGLFSTAATGVIQSVSAYSDTVDAVGIAQGTIGTVPFTATVRVSPYSRLIRIGLDFDFGTGVDIGSQTDDPIGDDGSGVSELPSFAKDADKLRLTLPLAFASPSFYTHNAFEVRPVTESRQAAIRFALAEGSGRGVAVFTDRASAIACDQSARSLELALAYGGVYWDGHIPLTGKQHFDIGLATYSGSYDTAGIPQLAEEMSQPLLVSPGLPTDSRRFSMVNVSPATDVVMTAAYQEGSDLFFRFWRSGKTSGNVAIQAPGTRDMWVANLRGDHMKTAPVSGQLNVMLDKQQVVTIRAEK